MTTLSLSQTMAEYPYEQLKSLAVDLMEDAITLEITMPLDETQQKFNFGTRSGQKEDIANLIASYAPAHQNWQKVGAAKTKSVRNLIRPIIIRRMHTQINLLSLFHSNMSPKRRRQSVGWRSTPVAGC